MSNENNLKSVDYARCDRTPQELKSEKLFNLEKSIPRQNTRNGNSRKRNVWLATKKLRPTTNWMQRMKARKSQKCVSAFAIFTTSHTISLDIQLPNKVKTEVIKEKEMLWRKKVERTLFRPWAIPRSSRKKENANRREFMESFQNSHLKEMNEQYVELISF